MKKNRVTAIPLQYGQMWLVEDSNLEIETVGKTLVHYKRYRGSGRGVPNAVTSKSAMEKYLRKNKAALVQA